MPSCPRAPSPAPTPALSPKNDKAPISHVSDKSNPHGVTAAQVGAVPVSYLPGVTDLNTVTSAGFYRVDTFTNGPADATDYGNIIAVHTGAADTMAQMYFPFSDSLMYYRAGQYVNGAWLFHDWRKVPQSAEDVGAFVSGAYSNSDANNCPDGSFKVFGLTNVPGNGLGILFTKTWDVNYKFQLYHNYTDKKTYVRDSSSAVWAAWHQIYTDGNKPTAADIGVAQIATGIYSGTGTYGSSNKNSLTFGFEPKLLIVGKAGTAGGVLPADEHWKNGFIWMPNNGSIYVGNSSSMCYFSLSGNTISWFCNINADYQCNGSGVTYTYTAIG